LGLHTEEAAQLKETDFRKARKNWFQPVNPELSRIIKRGLNRL